MNLLVIQVYKYFATPIVFQAGWAKWFDWLILRSCIQVNIVYGDAIGRNQDDHMFATAPTSNPCIFFIFHVIYWSFQKFSSLGTAISKFSNTSRFPVCVGTLLYFYLVSALWKHVLTVGHILIALLATGTASSQLVLQNCKSNWAFPPLETR